MASEMMKLSIEGVPADQLPAVEEQVAERLRTILEIEEPATFEEITGGPWEECITTSDYDNIMEMTKSFPGVTFRLFVWGEQWGGWPGADWVRNGERVAVFNSCDHFPDTMEQVGVIQAAPDLVGYIVAVVSSDEVLRAIHEHIGDEFAETLNCEAGRLDSLAGDNADTDYNYILSMEYVGRWGEFSDVCRYGSKYYVPWDEYIEIHDTDTGEVSKTTVSVVILRVLELVRGFHEADKLAGGAECG